MGRRCRANESEDLPMALCQSAFEERAKDNVLQPVMGATIICENYAHFASLSICKWRYIHCYKPFE